MTVIVALTYPGGGLVASDTRRLDGGGANYGIGSENFAKTLRRDWDHPRAVNACVRHVIGGIAGQMFVGHMRLTAKIEEACSLAVPPSLDTLEAVMLTKLREWIEEVCDSGVVLIASADLTADGAPSLLRFDSLRGTKDITSSRPENSVVLGSGAEAAIPVLAELRWNDRASAEASARAAVMAAIEASGAHGGCGGSIRLEMWP